MTKSLLDARVAAIRRFNRFYTKQIGALQEGLLDSEFSLAEARVLYELAHADGDSTATGIGTTLGLDAGYLSRLLRSFEERRLMQRRPSSADGRRSNLTLTRKGRNAFTRLDASARAQVATWLEGHPPADQRALVTAMESIEQVLASPESRRGDVELRAPRPGDMGWVIQRHGELYAEEYGWSEHFEALVAQIIAQFMHEHDPARERCWIASLNGTRVGSIFLVKHTDTVARLRLLLVEPSARGMGVGRTLVDACLQFARDAGYERMTLWTNAVLNAARAIYVSRGFRLVREEAHTHFGSEQLGQDWELEL
ncbi:MAG TPA: helix-turn-helix domain-containing GNAT family N-acetyltransferase [Gemmatimonadaceae bacterium]|jgi:DNA-binding MarR family transcriptional regulator/GNAT superfamily N-acetyltransferase